MHKRLNFDVLKTSQSKRNRICIPNEEIVIVDTDTSKFFSSDIKRSKDVNNSINESCSNLGGEERAHSNIQSNNNENNLSQDTCTDDNHRNINSNRDLLQWTPKYWKEHLNNIIEMRKECTAPVDEMGCHKCADKSAANSIFRFQSLIALMLSSQTKDQITYSAMQRLKAVNCTPMNIISLSDEKLGELIYPVSFWKRKVQYIKKTSKVLLEKYGGDIPANVEDLCKLPGVGPKMAHLCMQVAWNQTSGIGVDTHVHRISNRLKWVAKPTKSPEETRKVLESWLPKELWKDINYLLVGFGQEICRPVRPNCTECLNKTICPYVENKYEF